MNGVLFGYITCTILYWCGINPGGSLEGVKNKIASVVKHLELVIV